MGAYTSDQLLQMFTDRKELTPRVVNGVEYVDFYLTQKQAKWLESVRVKELGFPEIRGNHNFIGAYHWAMKYTRSGAGDVRMTLDGSNVQSILSPTAYVIGGCG